MTAATLAHRMHLTVYTKGSYAGVIFLPFPDYFERNTP